MTHIGERTSEKETFFFREENLAFKSHAQFVCHRYITGVNYTAKCLLTSSSATMQSSYKIQKEIPENDIFFKESTEFYDRTSRASIQIRSDPYRSDLTLYGSDVIYTEYAAESTDPNQISRSLHLQTRPAVKPWVPKNTHLFSTAPPGTNPTPGQIPTPCTHLSITTKSAGANSNPMGEEHDSLNSPLNPQPPQHPRN